MKFLVLGSSGQIGKPTVEFLKKNKHDVIEWDIELTQSHDLRIHNNELYDAMNSCDFVYYFASDVGGAKYLEKNQKSFDFISNNMLIMNNTFKALKITKKPFIFTSSQMSELHHSTYGLLKAIAEQITSDIGGLTVRLWNVYGEEKDEDKSHVITDFIKMAKSSNQIIMRTDGEESRQFLYVEDFVNCLFTLTNLYNSLDREKNYHITSFEWSKIKKISDIISKISGCEVIHGTQKDKNQMNAMNPPNNYILNFWKPQTSLEEGIQKIYDKL